MTQVDKNKIIELENSVELLQKQITELKQQIKINLYELWESVSMNSPINCYGSV
jgi:chromosome segregation ATPase